MRIPRPYLLTKMILAGPWYDEGAVGGKRAMWKRPARIHDEESDSFGESGAMSTATQRSTSIPPGVKGNAGGLIVRCLFLLGMFWTALMVPYALALGSPETVDYVVRIQNRQFIPQVVHLRVGQSTRLILKNEDTELHAFVPETLFVRANVQVSGNGAPQFGEQGFRRVLLPASGQTELVFAPKHAGSYAFFCDLPGHIMNGTVVVEKEKDGVQ